MRSTKTTRRPGLALLALVLSAGCTTPPTREVAAAEGALAEARRQGAERYAPERWKEADSALSQSRRRLQERDYRGALSSARDAYDKSRQAAQAAAAAKTLARGAAEVAQTEIQAALDEAGAMRDEARKAKVPDSAFESVQPAFDEARAGLVAISEALGRDDPLTAQRTAAELKPRVAGLARSVQDARSRWEAEHPRSRARSPARRKRGG